MRARALLLILALVALAGCSRRERANPLDPGNPATGGRPTGFEALAGNGTVTLRWNTVGISGVVGYEIQRRISDTTAWVPIAGPLSPTTSRFHDIGLINGRRLDYRLYYIFNDGLGTLPAQDSATPGSQIPWVADFDAAVLARLTADGRHVAARTGGFDHPAQLAVDPGTGQVWISDPFVGNVTILTPLGGATVVVGGFQSPDGIAVDPSDHTAWVCEDGGEVRHLHPDGSTASPGALTLLDLPIAVALDPVDRGIWVCERGGNRMRHYLASGVPDWAAVVRAPSRVAVDSVTHAGWVTSFETATVFRIDATGAVTDSVGGFGGPIGIAVDSRRGHVWVADTYTDRVVVLDRNGNEVAHLGGVPEAREVAVNPATGEAWVTAPASGSVYRLSADATVLQIVTGLGAPYGIAVDDGYRGLLDAPPAALLP